MKFNRLIALLPSQSLEDFDLERKEADAEQLLAAWSALWHPALLASSQAIPSWIPAASPPPDPADYLVVVPDCSLPSLPENWLSEAAAAGACVLQNLRHRDEMLAAALERLDDGESPSGGPSQFSLDESGTVPLRNTRLDPDLAADFLALGYCHFQVELLTRKFRYMSSLDHTSLQTAAVAAAGEAVRGDAASAREHLQSAFDRLHEAHEYYHPVAARLLDLTLLAPTTLGDRLRAELADGGPRNFLASGEVIAELARREPETLDRLKQALVDGTAALVGGEFNEVLLPLLGPEAIRLHLSRGLAAYQEHLGHRPVVFGRRRFGLTPVLPQILVQLGFTGAFHCTLDDGRFPTSSQSRIQWKGIDGTTIESLACLPIDAGLAAPLLQLAEKLGDTVSSEPAVMLAHWPGRASSWYDDLRRIAAYGAVLGTFSTITACLDDTSAAGQHCSYKPDEYHSPYLRQDATAGRRDPISRWVRYFRRRAALESLESLATLAAVCGSSLQKGEGGREKGEGGGEKGEGRGEKGEDEERQTTSDEIAVAIEDSRDAGADTSLSLDADLAAKFDKTLAAFARSLSIAATSAKRGCLIVNPCSFSQRANLHPSSFIPHPSSLDVPAMGFAWIDPNAAEPSPPTGTKGWFGLGHRKPKEPPPLADENVLRNEFCEIRFDPHTGAIRAISDYHSRDPRLAQQIALRLPHGDQPNAETNYSIMSADEIVVTSVGPVLGEIVCHGRLLDREGRRLAGFQQATRLWRGSRVIELEIELDVDRQPAANPWDSYYAVRFAWKDDTAGLCRSVNMANVPTELTQIESPHFLDLCRGKQRTTLLCGGLPYHRRLGLRKLDTLLVVQGETARTFRLGIGIDVPHPMAAALGFLAPPLLLPDQSPPSSSTGWFFHLDCRNVLATHWEPFAVQASRLHSVQPGRSHHNGGVRVRLLETDGCGVQLRLRCFCPLASARKINPGAEPPTELAVEGDGVNVPIGPHQWIELEIEFS